jgi:hypothetical protein
MGALLDLSRTGHYLHWGFVQVSVANLVVVGLMIVVFVVAVAVPFRHSRRQR